MKSETGDEPTSGQIAFDLSDWPVVLVQIHGPPSRADIDDYLVKATALLAREKLYAIVFDARKMSFGSAYARARARAWMTANREKLRKYSVGAVYVVASPLMRFVMTTVLLPVHAQPYLVCGSVEEGLLWARERIRESGRGPGAPSDPA